MSLETWNSLPPMSKDATINGNGSSAVRSLSPAVQALERAIADIALTNIPVLLIGESGTGKKFLAQQIHRLSPRRERAAGQSDLCGDGGETFAAYFPPANNGHDTSHAAATAAGNGKANGGTLTPRRDHCFSKRSANWTV